MPDLYLESVTSLEKMFEYITDVIPSLGNEVKRHLFVCVSRGVVLLLASQIQRRNRQRQTTNSSVVSKAALRSTAMLNATRGI